MAMKITHYFQKAQAPPPSASASSDNKENDVNNVVMTEDERRMKMMQNGTKRVEKALLSVDRELFVKNIATLSRLPDRYFDMIPNPFIKYALKKELALRKRIAALKHMSKQEKSQYKLKNVFEANPEYDALLTKFLAEKYEDTLLVLQELPDLPAVSLPDGATASEFEACLHITQFVASCKLLLRSFDALIGKPPSAESLLQSLYQSKEGFAKGSRTVLFALAQFLITDGYKKESTKLHNFAALVRANVSSNNVFRLVKFLLVDEEPTESRNAKQKTPQPDGDIFFDQNENLQDALLGLRKCSHFSLMSIGHQLAIMQCLVDKAMLQESFGNFITDNAYIISATNELKSLQQEAADLGRKLSELPPPVIVENGTAENCPSRQESAELTRLEKERMKKIDEYERIQLSVEDQTQYVKEIKEASRLRIFPLGTDRFHRVYWFFKESPNQGVFVEETKESEIVMNSENPAKKRSKKKFLAILEENVSGRYPPEYNKPAREWKKIETKETFDALCQSLNPNGVREGALRKKLQSAAEEIKKSFPKINNNPTT